MHISSGRLFAAALLAASLCRADLAVLATMDGASGYESHVAEYVAKLAGGKQQIDNTGSLTATFGSGSPHTMLIAGLDEPGYVVSAITPEGYLRVHRLSATPPHHNFDSFFAAQPVRITTAKGSVLNGVVAGLSVHLQSERYTSARIDHPDQLYVDIGARSEREAREAGVDVLDPVTLDKSFTELAGGDRLSAPWISARSGAAVLLELARRLQKASPAGTVTLAFVSQQYAGFAGLARVLARLNADRIVWLSPGGGAKPSIAPVADRRPEMADELMALATKRKLDIERETAERFVLPAFADEEIWKHPGRAAALKLGVENSGTPVEVISRANLTNLTELLAQFAGIAGGPSALRWSVPKDAPPESAVEALTETYGVAGHEAPVRSAILELLPAWARSAARVDAKGNLIVEVGAKPERLFLAHMDELGFEVVEIGEDGKLRAETRGGGLQEYFEWRAGMAHTESKSLPALLLAARGSGASYRVEIDVGAASAEQVRALGIKIGDTVTVRKQFHKLLGTRAASRSSDDRVGCAVLVETLRALKREEIRRPTWFVFTVEEELGLRGAEFLAQSVRPKEVYAIDTFSSSDSPLENHRLGWARLGEGFVIRAIDGSGISPWSSVLRVAELARRHGIPVQYGVTAGANDGSKFVSGGAVNVPLGFAVRYSHSPVETIDLADAEALGKLLRVLVKE